MVNGLVCSCYHVEHRFIRRTHVSSAVPGSFDPTERPVVPGPVTVREFVHSAWTKVSEEVKRGRGGNRVERSSNGPETTGEALYPLAQGGSREETSPTEATEKEATEVSG
ncbi:hypothetical protein KM043_009609 [Ampulex compressa]|nr:hypothetical protein KM043_009609 [Ampulex compressa]